MGARRVLVIGSPDWTDWHTIMSVLGKDLYRHREEEVVVIHGGLTTGADELVEMLCRSQNVPTEVHQGETDLARFAAMVASGADACYAFLSVRESASWLARDMAKRAGIPTRAFNPIFVDADDLVDVDEL
jgi:hypothetical protein